MSRRFFAEQPKVGETMVLSGDQAHHIANVMRFKPGEQIVVFDGSGLEYSAELADVSKKKVTLFVISEHRPPPLAIRELTLAVALPKGDRQKFLVEKLVELGVARLIPLKTERGVSVANEKVIARLEKQVIEACKQCGRNELMQITPAATLAETATMQTVQATNPLLAIASPEGQQGLSDLELAGDQPLLVAIGPEGGFSEPELRQAESTGWHSFTLGPLILRIETAAVAVAAIQGIGQIGSKRRVSL